MKDLTKLVCIVDMSGSMSSMLDDVIGGFDAFIKSQQELPGDCEITLTLFDTTIEIPVKNIDIKHMKGLKDYGYRPRGGTALNDAIGETITTVGEELHNRPESERPSKVIVVIQTDGEENSSKEYSKKQLKEMIKKQEDIYKWEFIFLGANFDAKEVGRTYGFSGQSCSNYDVGECGEYPVFSAASCLVADMRSNKPKDII